MMEKAQLSCQKCKYEWEQDPKPAQCPKCGHVYLTWLNHPLVIERGNIDKPRLNVDKEPGFMEKIRLIDKALENG